jgi:hypothetical protein
MGILLNVDPNDISDVQQAVDDIINDWGKHCQLIYNGQSTICPNCIVDPATRKSTGRYKADGPIPFPRGEICPVCDGTGAIVGQNSFDIVKFVIDWQPRSWINILPTQPDNLRVPGGFVATQGFITDLTKVARADSIIIDIDNNYFGNRFTLIKQPISIYNFIKNRYFMAYWQRSE